MADLNRPHLDHRECGDSKLDREERVRVFCAYEKTVKSYARAVVGNIQDAEDLTQEVFLKYLMYDTPVPHPYGWLFKTANWTCIDFLRRKRPPHKDLTGDVRDSKAKDPVSEAMDSESTLMGQLALAELPDAQREVVMLRVFGGGTWTEIAKITGQSEYVVHRLYNVGIAAIRKRMGDF